MFVKSLHNDALPSSSATLAHMATAGKALPVHREFLLAPSTVLTVGGHCWIKSSVIPHLCKIFYVRFTNLNVRTVDPGISESFMVIAYFPLLFFLGSIDSKSHIFL